jgi:hypothetical protein
MDTVRVESWEFGRTVRRWRDRVAPATVGVPVGRRRRATGLRREELVGLAGISTGYLTPGRAARPSTQRQDEVSGRAVYSSGGSRTGGGCGCDAG